MAWHAVEAIEEAAKETRELLLPFNLGLWAKLTLLTILTGSGLSTLSAQFSMNTGQLTYLGGLVQQSVTNMNSLIIMVAGLTVFLSIIFLLVTSIAEFAFFKSLMKRESYIRKYFRENLWKGFSFAAYRVITGVLTLALILFVFLAFSFNPFVGVLMLLMALLVFAVFTVFDLLVRDLVLVEMIEEQQGLIESLKTTWREFRPQWKQIAVYVVVRVVLVAAVGVALATAAGFAAFILFVPAVLFLFLTQLSVIFLIPLILIAVIGFIVITVISMPFQAYIYNYKIEMYRGLKEE